VYPDTNAAEFRDGYANSGGSASFDAYWSFAYGRMAIREALRRNVVFFQHNLATDYALGEMNVIFCRNVLIYFGEALRGRVVEMFSDSLRRGGFLCLGTSEHLPKAAEATLTRSVPGQQIYRCRGRA
jgi:chemotaxis protein methyltransferase CheR